MRQVLWLRYEIWQSWSLQGQLCVLEIFGVGRLLPRHDIEIGTLTIIDTKDIGQINCCMLYFNFQAKACHFELLQHCQRILESSPSNPSQIVISPNSTIPSFTRMNN